MSPEADNDSDELLDDSSAALDAAEQAFRDAGLLLALQTGSALIAARILSDDPAEAARERATVQELAERLAEQLAERPTAHPEVHVNVCLHVDRAAVRDAADAPGGQGDHRRGDRVDRDLGAARERRGRLPDSRRQGLAPARLARRRPIRTWNPRVDSVRQDQAQIIPNAISTAIDHAHDRLARDAARRAADVRLLLGAGPAAPERARPRSRPGRSVDRQRRRHQHRDPHRRRRRQKASRARAAEQGQDRAQRDADRGGGRAVTSAATRGRRGPPRRSPSR